MHAINTKITCFINVLLFSEVNITLGVQALATHLNKYSVICAADDNVLLQLSNNDIPIGQEWNNIPFDEERIDHESRPFQVCEGSHIFIMNNIFIDFTKANNSFEGEYCMPFYNITL